MSPPPDGDAALMVAFGAGDERAFDLLYARWRDRVHRFAVRMVGGPAAEELAQETFVRLYRARGRYQPTAAFATYLFRIAAHLCANERRRASNRYEVDGDDGFELSTPPEDGPQRHVEGRELGDAVENALFALPERQRAAIVLARYEGCSMAELAEVLDVSEGAAKVLLHRARERLKVALAPWLEGEHAGEGRPHAAR